MLLTEPGKNTYPTQPAHPSSSVIVAGTSSITNHTFDSGGIRTGEQSAYFINMTIEGRCRMFDGDDAFFCTPGDLLLLPPEVHQRHTPEGASPDWRHHWVCFRPSAYRANWLKWRRQTNKVGRMRLSRPEVIAEFETIFLQIEQNLRGSQCFSENLAANLLERLLIRCYQESPDNRVPAIDPRIEKACQYLMNNLSRDVALDDIAAHVCLSPSRLGHLFREEMGVSIVSWLKDQRIALAKDLLQNSQSPIARIAGQIGYEDQMYFSRVFRKCTGMTPSEYRRIAATRAGADKGTQIRLMIDDPKRMASAPENRINAA